MPWGWGWRSRYGGGSKKKTDKKKKSRSRGRWELPSSMRSMGNYMFDNNDHLDVLMPGVFGNLATPSFDYAEEDGLDIMDIPDDVGAGDINIGSLAASIVGIRYYRGTVNNGEMVNLEREPTNKYDPNAIKVINVDGVQVGHIKRELANPLSYLLDQGLARIEGVVPNGCGNFASMPVDLTFWVQPEQKQTVIDKLRYSGFYLRDAPGPSSASYAGGSGSYAPNRTHLSDEQMKNELDKLFENLDEKDKTKCMEPSDVISTKLFPHQKQALNWMVQRENAYKLPPFWEEKKKGIYFNTLTVFSSTRKPAPVRGGILADDMGLGKTLEMISLIMTNFVDKKPLAVKVRGKIRPSRLAKLERQQMYRNITQKKATKSANKGVKLQRPSQSPKDPPEKRGYEAAFLLDSEEEEAMSETLTEESESSDDCEITGAATKEDDPSFSPDVSFSKLENGISPNVLHRPKRSTASVRYSYNSDSETESEELPVVTPRKKGKKSEKSAKGTTLKISAPTVRRRRSGPAYVDKPFVGGLGINESRGGTGGTEYESPFSDDDLECCGEEPGFVILDMDTDSPINSPRSTPTPDEISVEPSDVPDCSLGNSAPQEPEILPICDAPAENETSEKSVSDSKEKAPIFPQLPMENIRKSSLPDAGFQVPSWSLGYCAPVERSSQPILAIMPPPTSSQPEPSQNSPEQSQDSNTEPAEQNQGESNAPEFRSTVSRVMKAGGLNMAVTMSIKVVRDPKQELRASKKEIADQVVKHAREAAESMCRTIFTDFTGKDYPDGAEKSHGMEEDATDKSAEGGDATPERPTAPYGDVMFESGMCSGGPATPEKAEAGVPKTLPSPNVKSRPRRAARRPSKYGFDPETEGEVEKGGAESGNVSAVKRKLATSEMDESIKKQKSETATPPAPPVVSTPCAIGAPMTNSIQPQVILPQPTPMLPTASQLNGTSLPCSAPVAIQARTSVAPVAIQTRALPQPCPAPVVVTPQSASQLSTGPVMKSLLTPQSIAASLMNRPQLSVPQVQVTTPNLSQFVRVPIVLTPMAASGGSQIPFMTPTVVTAGRAQTPGVVYQTVAPLQGTQATVSLKTGVASVLNTVTPLQGTQATVSSKTGGAASLLKTATPLQGTQATVSSKAGAASVLKTTPPQSTQATDNLKTGAASVLKTQGTQATDSLKAEAASGLTATPPISRQAPKTKSTPGLVETGTPLKGTQAARSAKTAATPANGKSLAIVTTVTPAPPTSKTELTSAAIKTSPPSTQAKSEVETPSDTPSGQTKVEKCDPDWLVERLKKAEERMKKEEEKMKEEVKRAPVVNVTPSVKLNYKPRASDPPLPTLPGFNSPAMKTPKREPEQNSILALSDDDDLPDLDLLAAADEESAMPGKKPADSKKKGKAKAKSKHLALYKNSNVLPDLDDATPSGSNDILDLVGSVADFDPIQSCGPVTGRTPTDKPRGTLIICPVSVISNWVNQFDEHVHENCHIALYTYYGQNRIRNPQKLAKYDVVITTYSTLTSDSKSITNPLKRVSWLRLVLDEGHVIRNPSAQQTKAVLELKAERKWVLTGTPIQNSMKDFYSLVNFLRVSPFTDRQWWLRTIERPLSQGKQAALKRVQLLMASIAMRRTKTQKINGQPLVNLTKKDVFIEHVEFSEEERKIYDHMHNEGRLIVSKYFREGTLLHNYGQVLAILCRLRQLCCHPFLLKKAVSMLDLDATLPAASKSTEMDDELRKKLVNTLLTVLTSGADEECSICLDSLKNAIITPCAHVYCRPCIEAVITAEGANAVCPLCRSKISKQKLLDVPPEGTVRTNAEATTAEWHSSTKVDALMKALVDLRAEDPTIKSMVVSQFTSFLDVIETPLSANGFKFVRFDGTMSQKERTAAIEVFSDNFPDSPTIFLMSMRAGGVGVNLTAASRVFMMDPAWNPAAEDQCYDRCHRLGQTKDVIVTRFLINDSVEGRMLELQEKKRSLMAGAFSRKKPSADERRQARIQDIRTLMDI